MLSFPNLCRLCMSLENLKFNIESADSNNITVHDKLKWLQPNLIQPDDNLPILICGICHEKLNLAFTFKEQCLQSYEKLKDYAEHFFQVSEEVNVVKQELEADNSNSDADFTSNLICKTEIKEDEDECEFPAKNKRNRKINLINKLGAKRSEINRHEYILQKSDSEKIVYISNYRENIFVCNNCQRTFSGYSALRRHLLIHIKRKDFKCDICGTKTYTKSALQSHKVSHQKSAGTEICNICGKVYKTKDSLREHLHIHNKNFMCEVCGKKFANGSLLKKHNMCAHSDKRDFVCNICGFAAKTPEYLKRHITKHNTEKTLECVVCKKLLKNTTTLKNHLKIHANDRKYTCHVCNKSFVVKGQYDIHFRLHSNEKPYLCTYCGKRFRRHDHYKNHVRIHTKEKPFACDICDKAFAQKTSLVVHKKIHNNLKPFDCEQCGITFGQVSKFKRHMMICKSA